MLVSEIMHAEPVVVAPEQTLAGAWELMRAREVRHLPVVDGGRLVGIVTDRDLRLATSVLADDPLEPGARVAEVMQSPVHTADPAEPLEIAARRMRELKIGCLPVLDGGRLTGIVTGIDILETLVRLCGADRPSSRLEVRLGRSSGDLAELARHLAERRVDVHSILSHPDREDSVRAVLRIGSIEARGLAAQLRADGFDVIWPAAP